jgi:hypothetical protein
MGSGGARDLSPRIIAALLVKPAAWQAHAGEVVSARPGGLVDALQCGRELLIGEYPLDRDVPVGEPVELSLGAASDVTVSKTVTSITPDGRGHVRRDLEVRASNAKPYAVVLEIRHPTLGAPRFHVVAEAQPHGLKSGDPVWRLTVPAQGETVLAYTVQLDTR